MNHEVMKRLIYDLSLEVAKLPATEDENSTAAKLKKIIIRMKDELEKMPRPKGRGFKFL